MKSQRATHFLGSIMVVAIVCLLPLGLMGQQVEKRLGELSVVELDQLIREISAGSMSNAEKIDYYSGRFLGTPYVLVCQADGPYARYETGPLMNFQQINCMTYCEQVLALALSSHYEEMFNYRK